MPAIAWKIRRSFCCLSSAPRESTFVSLVRQQKKEQRNPCRVKAKGTKVGHGVLLFHYFLLKDVF